MSDVPPPHEEGEIVGLEHEPEFGPGVVPVAIGDFLPLLEGLELPREVHRFSQDTIAKFDLVATLLRSSGDPIETIGLLAEEIQNPPHEGAYLLLRHMSEPAFKLEPEENLIEKLCEKPQTQRRPWELPGNFWAATEKFEPYENPLLRAMNVEMRTNPEAYASYLDANLIFRGTGFTGNVESIIRLARLRKAVINFNALGGRAEGREYQLDGGGTGMYFKIDGLGDLRIELGQSGLSVHSTMELKDSSDEADEEAQKAFLENAVRAQMDIAGRIIPELFGLAGLVLDTPIDKLTLKPRLNVRGDEDEEIKKRRIKEATTQIPDVLQDGRLRELYTQTVKGNPEVTFEMIGGLDEEVNMMRRALRKAQSADLYKGAGLKPKATVLLAGPPGCGKTMLAEAAANAMDGIFINARGSDVMSMWAGEAEKNVAALFEMAELLGREHKVVLFLDEIESLAPSRTGRHMMEYERKITAEFLAALNRTYPNCLIVAATNDPDHVDSAVIRSQRFNETIYIQAPDPKGREQIIGNWIKHFTGNAPQPVFAETINLHELSRISNGLSGADLRTVVESALEEAVDIAVENGSDFQPVDTDAIARRIAAQRQKEEIKTGQYL